MKRLTLVSGLCAVGLAATAGGAAPPPVERPTPPSARTASVPPAAPKPPTLTFEKFTLDNGLEVILHRDGALPLVAVNLWYHVGPVNEPRGRSGFAHLFEHLMFEGSKHVGRRFDTLLESAGATNVNGTTSWDRTNYFETVPREQLELALWIESDRMGFLLDALDPKRLEVQRGVVMNERRQSYENAPYGPSSLALLDGLFPAGHPYHGAVIGSIKDLAAARMTDVRAFHRAYYAPSNATLTLAGDFEPARARALVERYFATLPDASCAKRPCPIRPRQKNDTKPTAPLSAPRRVIVHEPVELARVSFGAIAPPAFSPDDVALDVAAAVLAGGKASRLYRALVVEERVASEVDASLDSARLASIFAISATAASGKASSTVEAALARVVTKLAEEGPTAAELARAKRGLQLAFLADLQLLNGPGGESGRAGTLQRLNHYLGDPGKLGEVWDALAGVSADEVRRVVATHLSKERRLTVVTEPRPKKETP